jgi:hypothetical protein
VLHYVNTWVFELAESPQAHTTPRYIALTFVLATVAGGLIGLAGR